MSGSNHTTPEDRPEYTTGDLIEVFNPKTRSYQWIEVEEVLNIGEAQILLAHGAYFCACWVKVDSIAAPGECSRRKRGN